MKHILPGIALVAGALLVACSGGPAGTAGATSRGDAERLLRSAALAPADAGGGFSVESTRFIGNEDAAAARPDSENARRQHAGWGRVLALETQLAGPAAADSLYSGRVVRVVQTSTLYETADGASAALSYTRDLRSSIVEGFLTNDGAGTKLDDVQLTRDLVPPDAGDESFAWRISGVATFETGQTVSIIADAAFIRAGRMTTTVMAVALASEPRAGALDALAVRAAEKMRAAL
jgi:hypothetical protein